MDEGISTATIAWRFGGVCLGPGRFGHQVRPISVSGSSRQAADKIRRAIAFFTGSLLNRISLAKLFLKNYHNYVKMKKVFDIASLVLKNVNREAEEDVFVEGLTSGFICRDRTLSIELYQMSPA